MKRDEVLDWMGRTVEYIRAHGRTLLLVAIGAVVVAAAVAAAIAYRGKQTERANALLAEALAVYSAPIDAVNPDPDDAENPSFGTEEGRKLRAEEKFGEIHVQFQGRSAGAIAAAYLGDLAAESGDSERAETLWREALEALADTMLAGRLEMNLINLDRGRGRLEPAVARLRELLNSPRSPLPGDVLLYELGATLEDLDRPSEAASAFERLIEEYESSVYAGDARRRLEDL